MGVGPDGKRAVPEYSASLDLRQKRLGVLDCEKTSEFFRKYCWQPLR